MDLPQESSWVSGGRCCWACGDPPLCQREAFVAFGQTVIASDVDGSAPGIQTDVHVRTSLQEGDRVTLEVVAPDGSTLSVVERPVAADGSAVFARVSVPAPRVTLRATGRGVCGVGHDELTVDVLRTPAAATSSSSR